MNNTILALDHTLKIASLTFTVILHAYLLHYVHFKQVVDIVDRQFAGVAGSVVIIHTDDRIINDSKAGYFPNLLEFRIVRRQQNRDSVTAFHQVFADGYKFGHDARIWKWHEKNV
jgi:hypothetical protein